MYPVIWGLQCLGFISQDDCDTGTSGDENTVIKKLLSIHVRSICVGI